jgi:hypothetical protein
MNVALIFRYTILVVSVAAMVVGVLIIVGLLVPRNFPEEFRVIMGIVIVLYGAYRFMITVYRRTERDG